MSKKGIYAVDPKAVERVEYANAEELASEISDWVMESGKPATIQTTHSWWSRAVVSPYVGDASNWSIGFPEEIDIEELISSLEEKGLFVSFFTGYIDWMVVDKDEYDYYSPANCFLPE